MSSRSVARVVVVAAVSLFILAAPTKEQSAATCPAAYEVKIQFWWIAECVGNPPICEDMEPQLLGTARQFCDWSVQCVSGDCNSPYTNSIDYEADRWCERCADEDP